MLECVGKGEYQLENTGDYKKVQVIQWQVTTRLVGTHSEQGGWSESELQAALVNRTSGFEEFEGSFEDSDAVYTKLMDAASFHAELESCDAITRLLTLYDVMSAAALHAEGDVDTLKVFLAPDGYFSDSKSGCYSLTQTRLIKHLLQSVICCQPRFRNWLILPGTIKWKNCDNSFGCENEMLLSMAPINTSAVVLYSGNYPLKMADGKVLNDACFFIEPVSEQPEIVIAQPLISQFDVYASQKLKREQDLKRHLFDIGSLNVGLEINQEQANSGQGNNCLSQALRSMGRDPQSLGLQILLSSGQLLLDDSLNISDGGIASSINGLVGAVGEAEPVSYQMFQKSEGLRLPKSNNAFYRRSFILPASLKLTGEPKKSFCINTLGQEQVIVFNYDLGLLRLFKSLGIGESAQSDY